MMISIVTPSFQQSEWLKLCVASVADQAGPLEHLVQDAGSDDGTAEWLTRDPRVKAFFERDDGMYDAVNRGLRRATGDILAYLNCDEQYLPGTLSRVRDYFTAHPEVDIVFGDVVIVNGEGNYLCHRKVIKPLKYHTWASHLSTFTCATFFRRRILTEYGEYFDPRFRYIGDADWMIRLFERKVNMGILRQFTSVFTDTGKNLSLQVEDMAGDLRWYKPRPAWLFAIRPALVLHHRLRRLGAGVYSQPPFVFSLYTRSSPDRRVVRQVDKPDFRWRSW